MKENRMRIIAAIAGAVLFAASLTQTAYYTGDAVSALAALLLGWMGVLVDAGQAVDAVMAKLTGGQVAFKGQAGATFTWLANPLLVVALVVLRFSPKTTTVLSVLSGIIILSFLFFDAVIDNEAGHYNKITGYGAGYWLWLASAVFVAVASTWFWARYGNSDKT